MTISSSVAVLKGVGPNLSKAFAAIGIDTIEDLLNYYPRRWEFYESINKIRNIKPGLVAFQAKVESVAMRRSNRHKRLTITEAILSDDTGTVKAVWFNQPYLSQSLIKGETYLFRGSYEYKGGYISLMSPSFEKSKTNLPKSNVVSVYPETKLITSTIIRKLIAQCIDCAKQIEDILPPDIVKKHKLIAISEAIEYIHRPNNEDQLNFAKRRIGFEELFELVLSGAVIKQNIKTQKAAPIKYDETMAKDFVSKLDFELTDAQKKAAHSILKDISSDKPMNRLLEGDVGSGKTIVALMASIMAINAGYQVAFMVPTEVLARQHFASITKMAKVLDFKCELLVSGIKISDRKNILKRLLDGEIDLLVGTHALISEDVKYKNLGLAIIDEQHRFGVNQRKHLKNKAKTMPHVLTMTATPIPRSLALVVYGDLDISIIDELPPGRKPIITKLVEEPKRASVYSHVDSLIKQGQQVYVVCPLISESDKLGVKSVEQEYRNLQGSVFQKRRIGLLHGKLKNDEKQTIMNQFKNHELDILVATSVIEVGVDVANATIMLIEGSERFGLAALHQLRGRVGRSSQQSHCYLFSSNSNPAVIDRLRALEKTNDGFRLAQIDLQSRGPGEIYGTAQHGVLNLRIADVFDQDLVSEVKASVDTFIKGHNLLEYKQLSEKINSLKSITSLD